MRDDRVTPRQAAAAVFTALLCPLIRVLPGSAAAIAGRGAWLSALLAGPIMAALLLILRELCRAMGPGEGAAPLFLRAYGPVLGRLALLLYGGWMLFYAGFVLRSGAERLASAIYPHSGPEPFLTALLAASLLAALGNVRAAARTAYVFRNLLLLPLVLLLIGALSRVEAQNLLPPLGETGPASLAAGAVPAAIAGGVGALLLFLRGYAAPEAGEGMGTALKTLLAYLITASALCLITVGTFGPRLTTRLSYPFFTLLRDLTLLGGEMRLEAPVAALWVFTDFLLCAFLLRCAHEALRTMLSLPSPEPGNLLSPGRGRWLLWAEAAAAGACALLVGRDADTLRLLTERVVPAATGLLTWGGFPLLWLTGRLRKKW